LQTHLSNENIVDKYLLYASWSLWLVSVIAGLFRQERTVSFLTLETGYLKYKQRYDSLVQIQHEEQKDVLRQEEIKKEYNSLAGILDYSETLKKKRSKQALIAYHIIKWSYLVGALIYVTFRSLNI
jgi:hypothetical protein